MKPTLKNKKTIIKDIAKGLTFGVFVASTAVGIMFGASTVKYNNYASDSEILNMAKTLECDMSYTYTSKKGQIHRMEYNKNEPIYVAIDEEFSNENKQIIEDSLNQIFNLLNEINPNYYYKIVDNNEFNRVGNKSKIRYSLKELPNVGNAKSYCSMLSRLSDKYTTNLTQININPNTFEDYTAQQKKYIALHETLHSLGLSDVYVYEGDDIIPGAKYQGNTIMNTAYLESGLNMISPNDYKALVAIYAPIFYSETEKLNFTRKYNKLIDEYERDYYMYMSNIDTHEGRLDTTSFEDDFIFRGNATFSDLTYNIGIKVENGKYTLRITDGYKNTLANVNGDTIKIGDIVYLKNVVLSKQAMPIEDNLKFDNGMVGDIVIYKTSFGDLMLKSSNNLFVLQNNGYSFDNELTM